MKLDVQGIEEIEITDPAGLCNPPVPQLPRQLPAGVGPAPQPRPAPSNPYAPGFPGQPQPMVPAPFGDPNPPGIGRGRPIGPWTGDIAVPEHPTPYTRHVDGGKKWGVGSEAIQRAGEQVDPEKWEKNWQASMGGEHTDGEGNSPQSSR